MAPNSRACSFIHASIAGSRSTAPLNGSNSTLIAPLAAFEIYDYVPFWHEERKGKVLCAADVPLLETSAHPRCHTLPKRIHCQHSHDLRIAQAAWNGGPK